MPVNGIELKEGQKWRTQDYGIVTIVKPGLNEEYPWRFIEEGQKECQKEGLSITDDGKYWSDAAFPILLELIEETPMKFNPQPGDKIICNNGEEITADKKEEVKEEPRYTVEEVTEAFSNALHLSWMGGHKEGIEKVKDYLEKKSNKEYQEYLRLKAIYG